MKKRILVCLSVATAVALLMGVFAFPASANETLTILSEDFSGGTIPATMVETCNSNQSAMSVVNEGEDNSACLKFEPQDYASDNFLYLIRDLDVAAYQQVSDAWRNSLITISFDIKFNPGGSGGIFAGLKMGHSGIRNDNMSAGANFDNQITPNTWTSLSTSFRISDCYATETGLGVYFTYWQSESAGPVYWFDNISVTITEASAFNSTTVWSEDFNGSIYWPDSIFTTTEDWNKWDNISTAVDGGATGAGDNALKFIRADSWYRGFVIELGALSGDTSWLYKDITFSFDYKMESTNLGHNYADYAIGATIGHDYADWNEGTAVRWIAAPWADPGVPKGEWRTITKTFNLVDMMGRQAIDAALVSGGLQIYFIGWPDGNTETSQYFDNFSITVPEDVEPETYELIADVLLKKEGDPGLLLDQNEDGIIDILDLLIAKETLLGL